MSQQEMQYENVQQREGKMYNGGYEAFSPYTPDYEAAPLGQKIAGQQGQHIPEDAHLREHRLNLRIGMAITSLILWMTFFFVSIAFVLNNAHNNTIQSFMAMGIGIFTILIVLANILISRKRI